MSDDIRKLRFGRWRIGWKTDTREGMYLRSPLIMRPNLFCGCWRLWIGWFFIGRVCRYAKQYD